MNHRKSRSRTDRDIPLRRRRKHHTSSKRKRTKTSDNHYQVIFNSVGDAILVHEIGGRFREANRIACERLGYTRKELLRMTPVDIDYSKSPELVAKRVGDMFLKAAVATALALIPSAITQGISAAVLTDFVARVIRSSARRMI